MEGQVYTERRSEQNTTKDWGTTFYHPYKDQSCTTIMSSIYTLESEAESTTNFYEQEKSAWSWEVEIRSNTEKF